MRPTRWGPFPTAGPQFGRPTRFGVMGIQLNLRRLTLPGTLISIGFGCLARVTQKVLVTTWETRLGDCVMQERPMTGRATLQTLALRKVLSLTVRSGIRLATTITGTELTRVAVTFAIKPAVLGLEALK